MESDQTEVNRRENARALARQSGSKAKFAERIGRSAGQVGHIIGKTPTKNIGKPLARHIEKCFKKEKFWLDMVHGEGHPQAQPATASGSGTVSDNTGSYGADLAKLSETQRINVIKTMQDQLSKKGKFKLVRLLLADLEGEI